MKEKIVWEKSDRAEGLQEEIDLILKANNIKSAWVSDRSCMGDFIIHDEIARHKQVQERLGLAFELNDFIIDVAERLRQLSH